MPGIPLLIVLLLFVANSLLHLFCNKYKNITKALILPTIMLCSFFVAREYSVFPFLAAIFSFAGDVLLEKQGFRWFVAGGTAFILSHLSFIAAFSAYIDFSAVSLPVLIPVIICYCIVATSTVFSIRKSTPEKSNPALFLYLLVNGLMNTFALMLMMSVGAPFGVMIYVGAILFFISDNCLFIECFHEKKPNLFLSVMGTYIVGEFLIIIGYALI